VAGALIEVHDEGRPHRVMVRRLSAEEHRALEAAGSSAWGSALTVRTGPDLSLPPIAGTHALDRDGLHFQPRFPFVSGVTYVARFAWGGRHLEQAFAVAAPSTDPPRVVAVHPSSAVLPENTLRLYVQFSRPMRARGVHEHVRLVDEETGPVPLAFVEVRDGLWDPGMTRLTLFFHPGRVKRGVAPGEELGPPLRAGRSYRMVIDGSLQDAQGVPLGMAFVHPFRVGEPDRAPPSLDALHVAAPSSPGDPVVVTFGEPIDHALAQRWVWVEDAQGMAIGGEVRLADDDTTWAFQPSSGWPPGRYVVRVRAALEDRAGNRFDRPFDRDPATTRTLADHGVVLGLPFEVAAIRSGTSDN
jgi:hypothetical protein